MHGTTASDWDYNTLIIRLLEIPVPQHSNTRRTPKREAMMECYTKAWTEERSSTLHITQTEKLKTISYWTKNRISRKMLDESSTVLLRRETQSFFKWFRSAGDLVKPIGISYIVFDKILWSMWILWPFVQQNNAQFLVLSNHIRELCADTWSFVPMAWGLYYLNNTIPSNQSGTGLVMIKLSDSLKTRNLTDLQKKCIENIAWFRPSWIQWTI